MTARLGILVKAKDQKDNEEPDGMTVSPTVPMLQTYISWN
jgi:hypothetical protein